MEQSRTLQKEVSKFIESQKKKLALYFLPSYSPDLNPDEHVWAYLKGFKLKAHQAKNMGEFKPLVLSKNEIYPKKRSSYFFIFLWLIISVINAKLYIINTNQIIGFYGRK